MADSKEAPVHVECPLISAWQKSQLVMNRLFQGKLVFLPSGDSKFKRSHLGENVDLLAPLIDQYGPLPQLLVLHAATPPLPPCSNKEYGSWNWQAYALQCT